MSYDPRARRDLEVTPAGVTLTLARPAASIRVFRPGQSVATVVARESIRELKLDVPDEVMLVEILHSP